MEILQKLLMGFITLIVGVLLVGVAATSVTNQSQLAHQSAETVTIIREPAIDDINETVSITLSKAPTGWKTEYTDCDISNFVLLNQSGATMTATTDYVLTASTGTITFVNNDNMNETSSNATTASYNYCQDEYLPIDWQRNSLTLVIGFFALALLISSIALFYSVAKDSGIL